MSSSGLCSYRDEVTELNAMLNNSENQRNPVIYKKLIQQVILYMTKGMDMTPLFATIVKAAATSDIVQKKLCYLYLCNCATSHPDLALLTINTLKRDAVDVNPMVRGLALRSMGSLRIPSLVEYTKDVMLKGLGDCSPYVRQAAVIGCLQLYHLDAEQMKGSDLMKKLKKKVSDTNLKVCTNAMVAFMEICSVDSTVTLSHKVAHSLLKRLNHFDEWGQQLVLDVLIFHRPKDKEDIYDILNSIDPCLKHANSGVLLAAVKLFIHLTTEMTDVKNDVFQRIKVPLLTTVLCKDPAISYTVLCHIEIILCKAPELFQENFSSFFCRENDPLYLKVKKLEILPMMVTESNSKQILNELSFHARHEDTSYDSIRNIGLIALLHPEVAETCIEKLFSFLLLENEHITSHTLTAFRNLVIKYNDKCSGLFTNLGDHIKQDLLTCGRASLVWMLGEFGEDILESPYILESLVDNVGDEQSAEVKLELLTATMKLFFKRPPECQQMLEHILEYCIEQEYHMDVRDRSLLYYRLLKTDINKARDVICCPRTAQFIDNTNVVMAQYKEKLFNEFNTLSIVFGQPSSAFILKEDRSDITRIWQDDSGQISGENTTESLESSQTDDNGGDTELELVAVDEGQSVRFELREKPNMSPQTFEALWKKLPEAESYEVELGKLPELTDFQRLLTTQRIYTMAATPPNAKLIRYFLYAQADTFILCEVTMDSSTAMLKSVIKMEDPSHVHSFIELFQNCLIEKSLA